MSINAKNEASIKGAENVGFVERERNHTGNNGLKVHQKTGLRVLIITQSFSRIVDPIFNSHHQVVGVLESASRNYKKQKVLYNLLSVVRRVYSIITGEKPTLKAVSQKRDLPYRFMSSSDDSGLVEWVKDLRLDVIVVFSMSQLLKQNIFGIPKYGTINLHPSILPDYRGPNPDFWQYYNMEMNPGVTVHYIDKGEDTGDIIFQERTEISLGIKSPARLDKLIGDVGVKLILKAIDALQAGDAPRIGQPKTSSTPRAKNLTLKEHKTIIDWQNWPIERIWHILRGTELWLNALPQPTNLWRGQRWIIEEFEKIQDQTSRPGEIGKTASRYYVACPEGRIYLSRKCSVKSLITGLLRR